MRDRVHRFRPHPSLARHLPHPGEGSCGDSVRHRDSADSSVRLRSRTEKIRTAGRSLPPGGEGGTPVPDEGETGERSTKRPAPPRIRVPGWRNALHATFKQRRSRLLAPRQGGGVRLRGAVWLSRSPLNPVCRFAQDDTWVTGARYIISLVQNIAQ